MKRYATSDFFSSTVVKGTIGRKVRRAERGYIDKKF